MTTNLAHETIRAARKAHQCDWCNQAIAVGESYVRQRNKDGADVWTWRAHAECYRASCDLDQHDLDVSAGVQFTRGCSCESGQHEDGAMWPCDRVPFTQATAGPT